MKVEIDQSSIIPYIFYNDFETKNSNKIIGNFIYYEYRSLKKITFVYKFNFYGIGIQKI